MKTPSRSKVDLSSIIGPYQLLGLFLLVVEGLLGYWLFRAESAVERGFTGLVMVLILFGLLYAVIRMKQDEGGTFVSPPGAATLVKPPEGEVTEREISSPAPEAIPAPDRSYLINLPPQGWRVRDLTYADWITEALGIKDASTKEKLFPSVDQSRDILIIEREKQTSIIPIPGRTTVDGQKLPTALETTVATQLSILPMERAQPPMFIERSLEHNFLAFVGQILNIGLLTVRRSASGLIPSSGRRYMTVELSQKIEDATVNGKEGQDAVVTLSVIGIQGELRDHMLMMRYSTVAGDLEVESDLRTLQNLVASFRPLKVVNTEEKRREIAALADKKFEEFLAENGEEIFWTEIGLLCLRLQGINVDDPETRLRTMKLLKPFEVLARETNLHDEALDTFWEALHRAETGDATDFKAQLTKLIKEAISERQEDQAEEAVLAPPDKEETADPIDPSGQATPS